MNATPRDDLDSPEPPWKPPDVNTKEAVFNFFTRKNSVCIDLSDIPRPVKKSEVVPANVE